jgi:signal peptide peptidase SppA
MAKSHDGRRPGINLTKLLRPESVPPVKEGLRRSVELPQIAVTGVRHLRARSRRDDNPPSPPYLCTMSAIDPTAPPLPDPRAINPPRDWLSRGRDWLPARFRGRPTVPVVRLSGVIGAVTPLRPGLTLAGVARLLDKAFATRHAVAVAIVINSPGGSPVQSRQIFLRIRQLATEKKLPVLIFVEDVAASGGYMLACAGDEIFVDPSSILGSIGVVGGSFGFEGLIKKLGVERRLYTAGEHKATLDPFLPEKPEDVERLKTIQREIHRVFIDLVKTARGARLTGADDYLFTGEYWAGERAVQLGLADAIGDLRTTLRARYGDEVQMPLIAPSSGPLAGLLGRRGGAATALEAAEALPEQLLSSLEARAVWARFGF